MILTGQYQRTRRKTRPSTTLSTINLTWTDLGSSRASAGTDRRRVTAWAMAHAGTHSIMLALLVLCVSRHGIAHYQVTDRRKHTLCDNSRKTSGDDANECNVRESVRERQKGVEFVELYLFGRG